MAKPGATAPSEDCLTLNVFSPAWKPEAGGFPVLVYIHGGVLFSASPSSFHLGNYLSGGTSQLGYQEICENLVAVLHSLITLLFQCKKGVITVTVQYRLGYLGFWNMGSSSCNLALWDLTMALSWIRDNIGYFNGNPDNVTVMGQSSGGSLADILALSPHSRRKFLSKRAKPGCLLRSCPQSHRHVGKCLRRVGLPGHPPGILPKIHGGAGDRPLPGQRDGQCSLYSPDKRFLDIGAVARDSSGEVRPVSV